MPDEVLSFDEILKKELADLRERRAKVFDTPVPAPPENQPAIDQAHQFRAFGVALSGGGIRSATFNLGILQGLAQRKLLPRIDYLSTVSGGGYIGTWLHSVIRRKHDGDVCAARRRLDPVANPVPGPAEQDPITFLRKYSSYLAPRNGVFSADSWVIAGIWFRNMLLNQFILIPFLAALICLALIAGCWMRSTPEASGLSAWTVPLAAFLLLGIAVCNAGWNLSQISAWEFEKRGDPRKSRAWPTVSGVLAACLCAFWLHWDPRGEVTLPIPLLNLTIQYWVVVTAAMLVLFVLLQTLGGFFGCYTHHHKFKWMVWLHVLWMPTVSAGVSSGALYFIMSAISRFTNSWPPVIWGPPALAACLVLGVVLLVGLMGADFPDAAREWLARVGTVIAMNCFIWIVGVGLSVYGPYGLAWLGLNYGGAAIAALLAWAGSTFAGVQAGKSVRTNGAPEDEKPSKVSEIVAAVAPIVFIVGLLILIAAACHLAIGKMGHRYEGFVASQPASPADNDGRTRVEVAIPGSAPIVKVDAPNCCNKPDKKAEYNNWFAGLAPFVAKYQDVLNQDTCHYAKWILLVCGGIAILLPLRFNINEFSMHHFYKNRLVRCYLGAGNADKRKPNRFTGFDPRDDLNLADLTPQAPDPYYGPYPIVNTALNLNAGAELATQERKASSFVFTPEYTGFDPPDGPEFSAPYLADGGYRKTKGFFSPAGPKIGTAMSISGAAASPNWGYHTSAPVAFLLTVFNVRLGWWVGNPRRLCKWESQCPSKRPGPLYGFLWLLWELIGQTTGASSYVYLSDGGHFENLGLYELVRRRCRYIIVGDGEQDNSYTFESLGGAIRKCRADFGVEIDIDVEQIRTADAAKRTHCVVGTIIYPETAPENEREAISEGCQAPADSRIHGWILYFKSSLTGDEPEDVKQYRASHPDFPHQTTLNQFFTESQFESYRRLGLHLVDSAFENIGDLDDTCRAAPNRYSDDTLRSLFQRMAALWYGPSPLAPGVATKHADAYSALLKRMCDDKDLEFLDATVVVRDPAGPVIAAPAAGSAPDRKAFFFVLDLIQLMENVWFDFGMDVERNRNNPKNQGWVSVFRHWNRQPYFKAVWTQVRKNYNPLFGDFVDMMAE